jgi:glycosyltransferase involved in cell wall biosynthesis
VLLVGNFLSASGSARGTCEDLADHLIRSGWLVLTTSKKPHRLARFIDMTRSAWSQRREYAVAQVDLYSGPSFFWAEAVCYLLDQAGKPYVVTLHGGNLPAFSRRYPWRVRRLLRRAAVVTTPSRYLLGQMRSYRADLRLLPNPLDLGAYRFTPRVRVQPRLIWLRAFHEIYNPVLAPRIAASLSADFPSLQLMMIGPDKGDGSLQRTRHSAAELGVAARIVLPGGVPKAEVPEWLDQGDIFLNTTRFESFGVAVMEAAAMGLCIVSTNVGELSHLWQDGHDALLVPTDDPEAMAAAVRRILTEPGLAERLSRNARAKAQEFDWSVVLPQWESLLADVAARGRS